MDSTTVLNAHPSMPGWFDRVRPSSCTEAFVPFASQDVENALSTRFERQAELYPSRVAVQSERHCLTYVALNQAANRVARAALAQVGPGAGRVGLLLAYDAELIIGLLGTLKAGKTYVPLDPLHPRQRSRQVLEDCQAQLVLTDSVHHALARELAGPLTPVINIDEIDPSTPSQNVDLAIPPDTPAYILYTSGSTGSPKGVVQTHRNILHCLRWYTNRLRVNSEDRLSLVFPGTYALAAVVTFTTLLNGAALLPCDIRERGVDILAEWLQREQITIHHTVPAVFRHFARTLTGREKWPSLRLICLGGDVAYRADFELYQRHFPPSCDFIHEFGATEALICCVLVLGHEARLAGGTVPAGYPGEDTEILILDDGGRELSSTEVGQLAIKSRYLTPGYWGRPDLTDNALKPSSNDGEERIYFTGDLGRLRPDGALEHLGRTELRVKVRGQTIELAEVETALLAAPAVKEAVVAAQPDERGETSLIAYLTCHPGPVPTAADLRDLLSQRLPLHMIPAAFVLLESIPLSPNGKVDRRALASQPGVRLGSRPPFVPPRDSVEQALAAIWQDLLGIEAVGVYDSFFDLGGNSLLAAQLLARVEHVFGQRLPLSVLLQDATIAYLGRLVPAPVAQSAWRSLVPIRAQGSRPPLFLVHAGFGDILCFAGVAKALGADQPCYGLQARGLDGSTAPLTRVEDIARYYIEEIQTVQPSGPYCIGGLSSGATIAYEMAQQLRARGAEVALLVSIDGAARPVHQPRHVNAIYAARFVANIASNTPHWLQAFRRVPREDIPAHARRRLYTARTTLQRLLKRGEWSRYPSPTTLMDDIVHILGLQRAEEWPEYRRRVAEALHEAVAVYRPQPYAGRLILFRAQYQPLFSPHSPTLGWGEFVLGGVKTHVIPGNHDTILYSPNVEQLARYLGAYLAAVDERRHAPLEARSR